MFSDYSPRRRMVTATIVLAVIGFPGCWRIPKAFATPLLLRVAGFAAGIIQASTRSDVGIALGVVSGSFQIMPDYIAWSGGPVLEFSDAPGIGAHAKASRGTRRPL